MTAMINTRSWTLCACALLMASTTLAGCSRVVVGAPRLAGPPPVPIGALLIEPARFPPQYPAAVLDGTAVYRALQDINGVAPGAVVTPAECAPPPVASSQSVAAEGIDSATASSLIVAVTRPAAALGKRGEQLRRCASFTTANQGVRSDVTVTMLPQPPVDADDSFAVDQTVTPSTGPVRRTLMLSAQISDTRVSVTWLHQGEAEDPDTASLHTLFSDAVLKVRRST
ncbi:hypothetical protein BHQ17_07390 [Mycolicibacterium holsaticum]|uniref:DUF5642 domain-containing protein n=2 Tax=Mycolicibacterium holsaticum TaxID=152142 RepID=A0A1E3RZH4_9MYCO|nr:hypothetical protein BHQ17_07390 [Mycolicibacterium holsaticum]